MPISRRTRYAALASACLAAGPVKASPAALSVDLVGRPELVFDAARNPCPGFAMPDINPRAVRDASGQTVLFALEQENRPFAGASLSQVKPTCRSALGSGENPGSVEPVAYPGGPAPAPSVASRPIPRYIAGFTQPRRPTAIHTPRTRECSKRH